MAEVKGIVDEAEKIVLVSVLNYVLGKQDLPLAVEGLDQVGGHLLHYERVAHHRQQSKVDVDEKVSRYTQRFQDSTLNSLTKAQKLSSAGIGENKFFVLKLPRFPSSTDVPGVPLRHGYLPKQWPHTTPLPSQPVGSL